MAGCVDEDDSSSDCGFAENESTDLELSDELDENEGNDDSLEESEPEIVTIPDSDEETDLENQVLSRDQVQNIPLSILSGVEELERLLEQTGPGSVVTDSRNKGESDSNGFDFDEFCKSMILGDELCPNGDDAVVLSRTYQSTLTKSNFSEEDHGEEHSDDDTYENDYLMDCDLSHQASRLIKISSAKALLLKGLPTANLVGAKTKHQNTPAFKLREKRFSQGEQSTYAKPRLPFQPGLPFLRSGNNKACTRQWRKEKGECRLTSASLQPRFRRLLSIQRKREEEMLTKAVLHETQKKGETANRSTIDSVKANISDSTSPHDHNYAFMNYGSSPDHTYSKPCREDYALEFSEPTCLQDDTVLHSKSDATSGGLNFLSSKQTWQTQKNAVHDTNNSAGITDSLFSKQIPETKFLPGLEDFTFLLSPQSEVSVDTSQSVGREKFKQHFNRKDLIRRIESEVISRCRWRGSKKELLEDLTDSGEEDFLVSDEMKENNCKYGVPMFPIQPTWIPSDVLTNAPEKCKVVGDKTFVSAMRGLNKRERGRPRDFLAEKCDAEIPIVDAKKQSIGTKKEKKEPLRVTAGLVEFLEARCAAEKRGISSHCLPSLPRFSPREPKEVTLKFIRDAIDHMNSLDWSKDSDFSEYINSGDLYEFSEGSCSVAEDQGRVTYSVSSSKSMPNLCGSNLHEGAELHSSQSDTTRIASNELAISVGNSKSRKRPAQESDYIESDSEESISGLSISSLRLRQIIAETIFKEEDLLSDIQSVHVRSNSKSRKLATIEPLATLSDFSEESEIEDDGSQFPDNGATVKTILSSREHATPIIHQKDLEIGSYVEISPDCLSTSENMVGVIENAKKDEAALKYWDRWGEKRSPVEFMSSPDIFCVQNNSISTHTNLSNTKTQVCSAIGITTDAYDKLTQRYSIQHGRHPDSLLIVKRIRNEICTLSANPPQEFMTPEKSYSMHLFYSMGFSGGDVCRTHKYRVSTLLFNDRELLRSHPNLKTNARREQKEPKITLKASFFHAEVGEDQEVLEDFTLNTKWCIPNAQFELIESQMVSDLRMCLQCVKDCITTFEYSTTHSKSLDLDHLAYNTNPAWYIVIENAVFYDGRYPASLEAAKRFINCSSSSLGSAELYLQDASVTCIGKLSIRFGHPYRLFHQMGCMHSVVFEQGRMVELNKATNAYPRYVQVNPRPGLIPCAIDQTSLAEWVVTNANEMEDQDYMYVCRKCAEDILNSETGRKQNIRWRGGFRIEYGTDFGRVLDGDSGWNRFETIIPKAKNQTINTLTEAIGKKCTECVPYRNKQILVELPDIENLKLYKFLQPFLLLRALLKPRKLGKAKKELKKS